ncbi:MAG: glycoside hydrolase family 3 C-terminal domain-containing protein [Lachnospiraceae bacterium]|nr:glycoside hydrolase family 3 C-terminal domain-containing protein [Lachnospiraceae bacterium]
MDYMTRARKLLGEMTLEEKVKLTVGADFWTTNGVERLGLEHQMLTDGPHGLRKQEGSADHLGLNQSVPATCFPSASASACSFDRELLYRMGESLGEKCQREDVGVILGPGVNMKRSPLCGRNFEYFSEDPYVAGEMAAALINGVQSKGVGTSLKHFAVNSQETRRMTISEVVDERALREIYLPAFETAVKKAQPWTVMCSYNRVNGVYSDVNEWLLTDVLRKEWGFEGLVVSDWGAVSDKVRDITSGMNLEMPGTGDGYEKELLRAISRGEITEDQLDDNVVKVVEMILKIQDGKKASLRTEEQDHEDACLVAEASAVLLKNEGNILPLSKERKIAFIGRMAKEPRYQGAGSSKINPSFLDNAYDEAVKAGLSVAYADGYTRDGQKVDEALIAQAKDVAASAEVVCIFAGLPDAYESEGFDRTSMKMPESHLRLIEAVTQVNANTVVVLQLGSPVELPFKDQVKGILLSYLAGQAGGKATVRLLTGEVNPSGRLAETWPKKLEDNPSYSYFPGAAASVEHRESIYIGYRYYDKAGVEVEYPFGYGLSYTDFAYENLTVQPEGTNACKVQVTVKNTGNRAGRHTVLLFTGKKEEGIVFRPVKELRGFDKISLEPGESKTVEFALESRAFSYYNVAAGSWCTEGGSYVIQAGNLTQEIDIEGDGKEALLQAQMDQLSAYRKPASPFKADDKAFEALLGTPIPAATRDPKAPYDLNCTLGDIRDTFIGKTIIKASAGTMEKLKEDPSIAEMVDAMMFEMPLRGLRMAGSMGMNQVKGIVDMANGKMLSGIVKMIRK